MHTLMDWQPMHTAPQDGTPILLRSRDFVVSGYWFAHGHQWVSEMFAIPVRYPLYWMPLPSAPMKGDRDESHACAISEAPLGK
jgi:hypothetical protein